MDRRTTISLVVAVCCGVAGAALGWWNHRYPTGAELDRGVDRVFTQLKEQMGSLPKKFDENTSLVGLDHSGPVVTFTYEFTYTMSELAAKPFFFALKKADVAASSCKDKDVRNNLDVGERFHYVYKDQAGKELGEFEVSKADCGNSQARPVNLELDAYYDQEYAKNEKQIVSTLPKILDQNTTWIGVNQTGRLFIYTYKLTLKLEKNTDFFDKQKRETAQKLCNNVTREDLDRDVLIRFVYKDPQGTDLGEFEITKRDC